MSSPISTLYTYFPLQFVIRMVIDLLIMAFGVFLAVKLYRRGAFDKAQRAACIVLFIWGAIVLLFTVLGRRSHEEIYGVNFEIFRSYRIIVQKQDTSMLTSVIQNIMMFIPVGSTLSVVFRGKYRIIISILTAFSLSLMIETCQLVLNSGFFELDDLFHNTLGALLGIILTEVIRLIYKRLQRR